MPRAQGAIEQLIRHRVAQHPRQTWLKYNDTEFTWEQVLSNIQRAANGLLALNPFLRQPRRLRKLHVAMASCR